MILTCIGISSAGLSVVKMPVRERRDDLRSLYTPGSRKYWALKKDSARVLFNALKANADDEGRLEGDVADVEALVPRARSAGWTAKSIEKDLMDMVGVGLIERYEVGERAYISVCMFAEKQQWSRVSAEQSSLPAPPSKSQSLVAEENLRPIIATPPREGLLDKQASKVFSDPPEITEPEPCGGGMSADEAYRESKSIFRRYVGKSMGSIGNRGREWAELIDRYGAEVVLAAVTFWAQDLGKRGRDLRWPVAVFLKQAKDWIEEVISSRTATNDPVEEGSELPRLEAFRR